MTRLALTLATLPIIAAAAWLGFSVYLVVQLSRSRDFSGDGRLQR